MLSVLQQLGMKSPASTAKKTRQVTLEKAFSRVGSRNVNEPVKHPSSTPPSMTTGASNTDNSSELNDDTTKPEVSQGHLRRAQAGVDYDNDLQSSTTSITSHKNIHTWRKSRDVSGVTTLVEGNSDLSGQLLQDGVQALDEEWEIDTLPREELQHSSSKTLKVSKTEVSTTRARHSTRRVLIDKVFSKNSESSTSVLGKRARETVEKKTDQAAALYGVTTSRLRARAPAPQPTPVEGHVAKKTRISEVAQKEATPEPVIPKKKAQKPRKTWLEKGLYVGQDRDFDPRLTEAQNKKKIAHKASPRKSFMPLPMYSGQKALENGRNFRLPYSVFSPLPPGQPKPDEWKKTQKSKFLA